MDDYTKAQLLAKLNDFNIMFNHGKVISDKAGVVLELCLSHKNVCKGLRFVQIGGITKNAGCTNERTATKIVFMRI